MVKPSKKKRSGSEVAEERVRVSEVALRSAACAYAAVAELDPSDPRWRRCWRALSVAAMGMVAEIREAAGRPGGHPEQLARLASSVSGGSSNG